MVIPLKANEVVIKAGDSSYLDDAEKICGKLILTNQRIYFITSNGHITPNVQITYVPKKECRSDPKLELSELYPFPHLAVAGD